MMRPNMREALGAVIRDQRVESSRTLRELSRLSGVSISHISDIERGIKDPSSEMVEDLCDSLDISLQELLASAASLV